MITQIYLITILIERKIKQLAYKIIRPPIIGFNRVRRVAGLLYLIGGVAPFIIPGINFGTIRPMFASTKVTAATPVTGDITGIFIAGEFFGPIATFKTAESVYGGTWGFVIDAFLAPSTLIIGLGAGLILTFLPVVLGLILLSGYDRYLRLWGFAYLIMFGTYAFSLSANSIVLEPEIGAILCIVGATITTLIGLDRARNWGLIGFNYADAYRHRSTGEYHFEGTMTKQEYEKYNQKR